MYDAIVIGARCAGAPLAMLLARRGGRILLLDRATFPSEIRHGHYIHRHGPRRLAAWGVLDRIVSPDCPPIASVTLDLGDFPLTGRDLVVDGIAVGYAPRRSVLDHVLVRAAVEAGVELREGCTLEAFLDDPSGVSGVRARGPHGSRFTERARLVIGADGRHSRVAALARAPMSEVHPAAASWYFSYWSGVACEGVELYVRGDRALFVHPTSDRLTANLTAEFSSNPGSGASYDEFKTFLEQRLPNADKYPQDVLMAAGPNPANLASSLVTITIRWCPPGEWVGGKCRGPISDNPHVFNITASIGANS